MFLLPRRQVWTQQPQGHVEIDWGNPLTRDLKFAFTGSEYTEKVSKKAATVTSFTKKPTASGIGYVQTGSGSVSYAISPLTGGACTLVSRFYFKPSASIYTECVAQILPTGNTSRAGLYANIDSTGNIASGYVVVLVRLNSENTIRAAVAGVSEGWHTVVASWNGGSVVSMWLDGIPATVAYNNSGSVSSFFVGGQQVRVSGNGANDNPVVFGAGINRALSDVEAKSISANPWQIFKRPDSRIFVPVSVGGGSTSLIVQDATHAHIADSPSFSMATYLAVAESLHAHAADNVTLTTTGTANLVVQEAAHAHIADGVTLTTQWLLAIAEALHSHAADNVALTLQTALLVLEALHGHTADNLTLGVTGAATLVVADATSGHSADNLAFSLNTLLAVFDAIHAHAADNLILDTSNATALTVQDSMHAHSADSLTLSLDTWLSIVEATHGHSVDQLTLSTSTALLIAEALHAHYADTMVLGFPSAPGSAPTVEEIVAAVLAALNATMIPVDVHKVLTIPVTGNWPTAIDNADALLARNWP